MTVMVSMDGMISMDSMIAMAARSGFSSMQGMNVAAKATRIAGRFKITPEGDIMLKPTNQDMRPVAGLSGDFKVTSDGIVFLPR